MPARVLVVHKVKLWNKTRKAMISLEGEGSSTLKRGTRTEEVPLVKSCDFLQNNGSRALTS